MSPDLTRATTFAMESAEEVRAVGVGERAGEFYPRYGHPAQRRFESLVAEAEGADGALAFASGMAALHAMFLGLCRSGDVVAVSRNVYGGTAALAREDLPRFGIEVRRFDPFDEREVAEALSGRVRLVHVDSPVNPTCRVVDLQRLVRAARPSGALVSVDATFVPPPLQRPLAHGCDLVMHSATKFLGGHSDVLAGVVSSRHELLEQMEGFRKRTGGILGPDAAWLLLRSMPTLALRARAEAGTAGRLAVFLDGVRQRGGPVERVHYPGLRDHPDHEVARRQMEVFGAVLAFEVRGGLEAAMRVYDRFAVIARAVSLGGVDTVASIPLHTSHAHTPPEERAQAGIADGLIRVSVGLEDYASLEGDLASALRE
jgi:cystathionine beta-lyase/cystathionine gamma-synthase